MQDWKMTDLKMTDLKITDLNLPNLKFDGTAVKPLPLHISQQLVK